MSGDLKIEFPTQGWTQFLTTRKGLLDAYDLAKDRAASHKVRVLHGRSGEAGVRKWLSEFLPQKFGVTSGYIVSAGLKHDVKTPHYDVIIYDVQNSPVLWTDINPDQAGQGLSRAISVEHVSCVLEVKSRFSPKTVGDAITHLKELLPLMGGIDDPKERYKLHLPPAFTCGLFFFELKKEDEFKLAALDTAIKGMELRNFFGGLILRGDGHSSPLTGRLQLGRSEKPITTGLKESLLMGSSMSKSVKISDSCHILSNLVWMETHFAQFAFDLIAMMQGTHEPGRLSSFYGIGR
jgi:hypothetical protein